MRFSNFPFTARRVGVYVSAALLAGASFGLQAGTPYTGTAIALPGTFEAENFDKGGQNSGYYDNTQYNDGGQYRTSEAVDIATPRWSTSVQSARTRYSKTRIQQADHATDCPCAQPTVRLR